MKNTTSELISDSLQEYKLHIDDIVNSLHKLTDDIDHKALSDTIGDLRNRMHEPFMFVIVGEVKAGKSSFINALLDTSYEICKVAPSPMTDTIQQIVYGTEEKTVEINPYLKRIYQPVDLLKEISIVDTPGTNTIIEHHQEITEKFIPASDLIVFVFEAKNPYRQSAWDFFNFIHDEWKRKVIFVLQQKDLMEAEDLKINIDGVVKYAQEKGISEPRIFPTSAKDEIEGRRELSGFIPLREFITTHITGGKAPFLKIQNNIETAININDKIKAGVRDRRDQYKSDVEFRKDVGLSLDEQKELSYRQIDILLENVVAGYNKITNETHDELESGLAFSSLLKRTFSGIFSKKKSAKLWFKQISENLELKLNREMKLKLDTGVNDLAESIQQMARIVDLKLQSSSTILKNDHEVFSDIAERRSMIMGDLRDTFDQFIRDTDNFDGKNYMEEYSSMNPNLATGGGIAIIGIILQALSTTAAFDVTGGILTAVGIVFAGVSIGWNRRKILRNFKKVVKSGEEKLSNTLREKLRLYTDDIREKFEANFSKFDEMLENEKLQLASIEEKQAQIDVDLAGIKKDLLQHID